VAEAFVGRGRNATRPTETLLKLFPQTGGADRVHGVAARKTDFSRVTGATARPLDDHPIGKGERPIQGTHRIDDPDPHLWEQGLDVIARDKRVLQLIQTDSA